MPFLTAARITITNETNVPVPLFYQIDYTVGDKHTEDTGRLHVQFQRENPTTKAEDFEILPTRKGKGRYLGAIIGVRPDDKHWWGEGEVKMYIDGDKEFATIVGTGSEDYVGLSWGLQQTPHLYNGANYIEGPDTADTGPISMYRWHMKDPIYWKEDIRVTMQQIGHKNDTGKNPETIADYMDGLFERQDDWSASTFWYEAVPSAPLPPMPDFKARVAGLMPK